MQPPDAIEAKEPKMSGGTSIQLLEQAESDFPLLGAALAPPAKSTVDINFHDDYPATMGEYLPS